MCFIVVLNDSSFPPESAQELAQAPSGAAVNCVFADWRACFYARDGKNTRHETARFVVYRTPGMQELRSPATREPGLGPLSQFEPALGRKRPMNRQIERPGQDRRRDRYFEHGHFAIL